MSLERRDFNLEVEDDPFWDDGDPYEQEELEPVHEAEVTAPSNTKRKKKGTFWRVLFFLSLAVVVVSLSALAYIFYTYWNGQNEYDELTTHMQVDDSKDYLTLASFNVDWDALRAINPDVVGWVYVPGTVINYPIVWRENDDVYYMKHNFGDNSVGGFGAEYGCISLSGANNPKWTDQASFIAGHHMQNGTMFAVISDMADNAFFNDHRTFYVFTPEGNFKTTAFAWNKVSGYSKDIVVPNFPTKEEFHKYIEERIAASPVTPNPPIPQVKDIKQIMGFYTCNAPDDSFRDIVYCYVEEFLPAGSDVSKGNSLVDEQEVADVGGAIGERLL